jgi:homoserine O-acetyltransferase/O-succinyltransferase
MRRAVELPTRVRVRLSKAESDAKRCGNSKFRVVDSLWAHFAMFCKTHSERDQIDACIRDLLAEPVD